MCIILYSYDRAAGLECNMCIILYSCRRAAGLGCDMCIILYSCRRAAGLECDMQGPLHKTALQELYKRHHVCVVVEEQEII